MMQHEDSVRLRHMLEYAEKAVAIAQGYSNTDLQENEVLCLALTRAVEIIGEAAARVSQPLRDTIPQIPWSQIVGLRNHLIHGYAAVDVDILWDIIVQDLPPLITSLKSVLGEE